MFDGAQGAGAVPLDVKALGCAAYAASGQKWMCGADGTGMLYLAPEFRARVRVIGPGYLSFADPSRGLESTLRDDGPAYDTPSLSREVVAFSLAAARVLDAAGLRRRPRARSRAGAGAGAAPGRKRAQRSRRAATRRS